MPRVPYEQLEPSEDYLLMCIKGEPFSGVALDLGVDERLLSETFFLDGQKHGLSREWSPSGRLVREQNFALNSLHGQSQEWYEDGASRLDGKYELAVCIEEREWDADGNLIRDYRIAEEGPQFATLKLLRKSEVASYIKHR